MKKHFILCLCLFSVILLAACSTGGHVSNRDENTNGTGASGSASSGSATPNAEDVSNGVSSGYVGSDGYANGQTNDRAVPNDTVAESASRPDTAEDDRSSNAYDGSQLANDKPIYESEAAAESWFIPNADEEYLAINENRMQEVLANPLLTFSLKVDTASYRNIVRYIESGNHPPADAVRMEEMINYFHYEQPLPENDSPFAIYTEIGPSPFTSGGKLAFIRVRSRDIDKNLLPPANLTFLIDVSGSMEPYNKLPLLKSAFGLLVETLDKKDTVSIVTYAGEASVVLDTARGNEKARIMAVINTLAAGGSTAGAGGIQEAYRLAEKNFIKGGNNRVILATDGDFNVGVSSTEELERLIGQKRDTDIYLSVLGVGTDNLKDSKMETLAKNGNGNYNYLDTVAAAKKVLVDELTTNLYVMAEDVKAQVEFNPALVSQYRLIGYENRKLANRDFADDSKDAGEVGIGTDVVLLFEFLPAYEEGSGLKYGSQPRNEPVPDPALGEYGDEFFEVRIRYKEPGMAVSQLIVEPVKTDRMLDGNTDDFRFASNVAAFGHILRNSPYAGGVTLTQIIADAEEHGGRDEGKLRKEFVALVRSYQQLYALTYGLGGFY